ncbi:hypothetical protein GCM10017744_104490 [Streptomyces antimycoticus]|uniref:Uncharacterized protein n=1 Tax=Streptomyces antimycoticus TaxID=68175 RepID=A0A4D4KTJ1_9ACTN|nr:hypothetical protein [Streptomyces antimycoticus]GDY49173.1 hypothetical protein SANT12839_100550 [Streptomyces antimycoticus]
MARAYDFPEDLLTAQEELHQVVHALRALYDRLPWSVEPHPGFHDPEYWRPRQRPATDGWSEEDRAEVHRLRAQQQELSIKIVTHPFWTKLEGLDLVTARTVLKYVHDTPTADRPAA